jgi:acyl-CoA reductase-like NAD-dependent aldehyde dehydrogenase
MLEALKIARLILPLAKPLKDAILAIVAAVKSGDDEDVRKALEAARRAAFAARQK